MNIDRTMSKPIGKLHYGNGYIEGHVKVDNVPSARMIYLTHRKTYRIVDAKMSDINGYYRFEYLDPTQEYDLRVQDWSRNKTDTTLSAVKPKTL